MTRKKNYTGRMIKQLRMNRGLTQEELAEKVFCDRSAISRMETGQHAPNYEEIVCLCRVLRCTPNDLFPPDTSDETAQYHDMVDTLGKLSPSQRERFLSVFLPSNDKED